MRPERRAKQVVGVADIGHPIAHRFVDRILQRLAAGIDLTNRGAEQLHADDVQRLTTHVLGAHVDMAFEAKQRAGGRSRNTVLTCAGFRDDSRLAHSLGEQRLAERVVDLVRAGMGQVFAFEQDAKVGARRRVPPWQAAAFRRAASVGPRSDAASSTARRRRTHRLAPQGSPASAPRSERPAFRGTKRPP